MGEWVSLLGGDNRVSALPSNQLGIIVSAVIIIVIIIIIIIMIIIIIIIIILLKLVYWYGDRIIIF